MLVSLSLRGGLHSSGLGLLQCSRAMAPVIATTQIAAWDEDDHPLSRFPLPLVEQQKSLGTRVDHLLPAFTTLNLIDTMIKC